MNFQARSAREIYIIRHFISETTFGRKLLQQSGISTLTNLALYMKYNSFEEGDSVFRIGNILILHT